MSSCSQCRVNPTCTPEKLQLEPILEETNLPQEGTKPGGEQSTKDPPLFPIHSRRAGGETSCQGRAAGKCFGFRVQAAWRGPQTGDKAGEAVPSRAERGAERQQGLGHPLPTLPITPTDHQGRIRYTGEGISTGTSARSEHRRSRLFKA